MAPLASQRLAADAATMAGGSAGAAAQGATDCGGKEDLTAAAWCGSHGHLMANYY